MSLAEVLDALLLLCDLVGEEALQVGAVVGDVADACDESGPVFLCVERERERERVIIFKDYLINRRLFTRQSFWLASTGRGR